MSKGKYRITITETGTGKAVVDAETSAVFAVAGIEGATAFAGLEGCSPTEALSLLWAVDSERDKVLNDNPHLEVGYALRDEFLMNLASQT